MWRSLVARLTGGQKVAGSIPVTPIYKALCSWMLRKASFCANRPILRWATTGPQNALASLFRVAIGQASLISLFFALILLQVVDLTLDRLHTVSRFVEANWTVYRPIPNCYFSSAH